MEEAETYFILLCCVLHCQPDVFLLFVVVALFFPPPPTPWPPPPPNLVISFQVLLLDELPLSSEILQLWKCVSES